MPALCEGWEEGAPGRGATRLSVKKTVLALPDLTMTAPENWAALCVITGNLIGAPRCQVEFQTADHLACLREGRKAVQKRISQR